MKYLINWITVWLCTRYANKLLPTDAPLSARVVVFLFVAGSLAYLLVYRFWPWLTSRQTAALSRHEARVLALAAAVRDGNHELVFWSGEALDSSRSDLIDRMWR